MAPPPQNLKPVPPWLIILVATMIGSVAVLFGTKGLKQYGYGVFVLLPLIVGWSVAAIYNLRREWHWPSTLGMVGLTFGAIALSLMMGLAEGMFCILLAGVLASPFIVLGICIAKWLKARRKKLQSPSSNPKLHCLIVGLVPAMIAMESAIPHKAPILEQTTAIEIDASPEVVWRFIPAFPRIEEPPTKMLAMGLAYPLVAEMDGEGIGSKRRCVLSTGVMPEVVTVWEPSKRLEFDVLETPAAMAETNPFGMVEAAHTEGYFVCKHGRFVLTPLPNGRTRVEGTSWFQHDLWPQFYWAPLTREVVRELHVRVLQHIKVLAEQSAM